MMLCLPSPVINHWGGPGKAGSRNRKVDASFPHGRAGHFFCGLDKEGPKLCHGHVARIRPPGTPGARVTTVPFLGGLAGLWDPALSLRALRVTCSPDVSEGVRLWEQQLPHCTVSYQSKDSSVGAHIPLWGPTGQRKTSGHLRVPKSSPSVLLRPSPRPADRLCHPGPLGRGQR